MSTPLQDLDHLSWSVPKYLRPLLISRDKTISLPGSDYRLFATSWWRERKARLSPDWCNTPIRTVQEAMAKAAACFDWEPHASIHRPWKDFLERANAAESWGGSYFHQARDLARSGQFAYDLHGHSASFYDWHGQQVATFEFLPQGRRRIWQVLDAETFKMKEATPRNALAFLAGIRFDGHPGADPMLQELSLPEPMASAPVFRQSHSASTFPSL